MATKTESYVSVVVESFKPSSTSGLHGQVHIRPVKGQGVYTPDMHVACSKVLSDTKMYPLGTKFKIRAKITDRDGGKPFIYSHYSWPYEVVKEHTTKSGFVSLVGLVLLIQLLLSVSPLHAQGKLVTLEFTENVYNTSKLNINGVAVKSMILIADSTTLAHALRGRVVNGKLDQTSRSNPLRNWLGGRCDHLLLIHYNETVASFNREFGIEYTPDFKVQPGRMYIIVKYAKDFVSVFQSFAQKQIPPPVLPHNDPPFTYKYEPFCETDACIALCVNKKEASFEVCCGNYCFTISFDGELNLASSTQAK